MTVQDALAILVDANARCATEDMRTPKVFAALAQLEAVATARHTETWPFDQFRRGLGAPGTPFRSDFGGRDPLLKASLNGIRRVCQLPV